MFIILLSFLFIASGVLSEEDEVIENHPNCRASTGIKFFPDKYNCSAYYSCLEGNAYRKTCPDYLEYNEAEKLCDYPSNANCSMIKDYEGCEGGVILPDVHDCRAYFLCADTTAFKAYCPDGFEYNAAQRICDYPEMAGCSYVAEYPGCTAGRESFEPHPQDCSGYYSCSVNGDAARYNCPDGYLFNPLQKACDLPERVTC